MDLALQHSLIGSFLQPPDKIMLPPITRCKWTVPTQLPKKLQSPSTEITPAPNREALLLALKTLQEKIHHLELERSQAEDSLNTLSKEAVQYKKAWQSETLEKDLAHQEVIRQKNDMTVQLGAALAHSSLLEKRLEDMRKIVFSAELERNLVLKQQTKLQMEKDQNQMKLCTKLEKLDILEKECFRVAANQRTVEGKIKQLEEKLCEEQHQRKLIQEKAAQLQTGLEIGRILLSTIPPSRGLMKTNRTKQSLKVSKLKLKPPKPKKSPVLDVQLKCDHRRGTDSVPIRPGKKVSSGSPLQENSGSLQLPTRVRRLPGMLRKHDIVWER
ncbi:centrosomal protein CEP57L1 isoform X2 [Ornithorhynchus anatinus]|uniref:centrosomal protein CEP57L1 isoform X2 n=1 Tax=Ornithorhynchus anatinus TaxID=9258 RepID=UPI000223FA13|nr:centrosomal protein CEP57L1 isoform X2 [Ornithorhynchus anatinus]